MCGIGGYRGPWGPEVLATMDRALVHRGPDQGGAHSEPGCGLMIRRLSVIDLQSGDQPIASEDGEVVTVFNGEIYNHEELRRDLQARGHRFQSRSDTEVIVHLYEEEGSACLDRLRGMFAIALLDRRRRTLFLARDRLGKKPLYYALSPEGLRFASEIKALLAAGVDGTVDPEALGAYARLGYIPAPATAYRAIRALPPAHWLEVGPDGLRIQRWWEPRPGTLPDSFEAACEELQALVKESVRLRLISDVPLGAFLSGGLDSTVVVGTMAGLLDRPVETFTIGFHEQAFDESGLAAEAAAAFRTAHHLERLEGVALEALDEVARGFDQPFADPSAVPTLLVSRLARRHVTVALSGDGGDELFGGYTRYGLARRQAWMDRVPGSLRRTLAASWPTRLRGYGAIRIAAGTFADRYIEHGGLFTPLEREAILGPELAREADADPFRSAEPMVRDLRSSLHGVEDLLTFDLHSYLPDVILTKVDRMSMACSLEARCPLLDHKLVEFVGGLPLAWRMGRHGSKRMLRAAFADLFPSGIRARGKMGFGVPLGVWLAGPLRPRVEALSRSVAVRDGLLRRAGVAALVAEHLAGRRDRGRKLWALLMLDSWWRSRQAPAAVDLGWVS